MREPHEVVTVCGGDTTPGPRNECHSRLHDHPLPTRYIDAHEVAQWRLAHGWGNEQCPECGLYGWVPGLLGDACSMTDCDRETAQREVDIDPATRVLARRLVGPWLPVGGERRD